MGWRFNNLAQFCRSASLLEFVKLPHRRLLALFLVGNISLVDVEALGKGAKQFSPVLLLFRKGIGLFDTDQEASLKVEEIVEI